MRRVVVTGMGAVTPIGNSVEEFWENIKKNTVGIGEITQFDVSGQIHGSKGGKKNGAFLSVCGCGNRGSY